MQYPDLVSSRRRLNGGVSFSQSTSNETVCVIAYTDWVHRGSALNMMITISSPQCEADTLSDTDLLGYNSKSVMKKRHRTIERRIR